MSQGVSKTRAEVKELEKLRRLFLEAPASEGIADYWQDSNLLELYDNTFARRIGWKWNAVASELTQRNWYPEKSMTRWIDWGCGTGVATEVIASGFESHLPQKILLTDRSSKARQFAQAKLSQKFQAALFDECHPEQLNVVRSDLVLLSHVLTELNDIQLQALSTQLASAGTIIWVEPGTPFCSHRLIRLRNELSTDFNVVAPCPHQAKCTLENSEKDWCHMFAQPPKEVFHDPEWAQFSKTLNIDLRSLPTSFLVLEHKSVSSRYVSNAEKQRLIGRPRFYKGHAKLILCDESGVNESSLNERHYKREFKAWQRDSFFVELTNAPDSD